MVSSSASNYSKSKCHLQSAIEFTNKVKLRFQNDESSYRAFLKAVRKKHNTAATILRDHQDLLQEFKTFVPGSEDVGNSTNLDTKPHCSNHWRTKGFAVDSEDYMQKVYRKGFRLFGKVRDCLGDSDEYLKFLSDIHDYSNQRIGMNECLAKYPHHLRAEFEELMDQCENINKYKRQTQKTEDVKVKRNCNGLKEKDMELMKWEHYRYEFDVIFHRLQSTAGKIEEILREMNQCKINITTTTSPSLPAFNAKDRFSIIQLRCIETLYNDRGLEVLELLNDNPILTLPILLEAFKEKIQECQESLQDFNSSWTSIQHINDHLIEE